MLLLIAAAFWPLHILTVNLYGIVRPERVFGIIAVIWLVGMLILWVLTIFGMDLETAENTSFVVIVFAMNGGTILREFGTFGYVILIACPVLAGWLMMRLKGQVVIKAIVWAAAVALAVGPLTTLIESWNSRGGPSAVADSDPVSVELTDRPDIFLVVFDGYPGSIAAQQDRLGTGSVDVVSDLSYRGFQVPSSSWSSYWITELSIPSLLEMNYPVVDAQWRGAATSDDLKGIVSGESVFVDSLRAAGYETHMVETGWSAGACGDAIDHCVPSPLLDEATHLILKHTVVWHLIEDSPGPYVVGTLAGFDWLLDHAQDISRSDSPDLVFMHVISPHPPLLLDDDCSVDLIYQRMGTVFNHPGVPGSVREGYLIDQMDCLDRMMLRLADAVDPEDIVIFVSDHGTDRRDQFDSEKLDWDYEATVERLNNFLALRLPGACEVDDPIVMPNVLRAVMDCLSPATVERLPERMWVNPMVELDESLVDELLAMRAEVGGPGVDLSQPTGTIP